MTTQPTHNPNHEIRHWETVAEFVAHHNTPQSPNEAQTRTSSFIKNDAYRTKFTGAESFEAAAQLAVHGWQDGLKKVSNAKKLVKIPSNMNAPQITPRFDEEGDEVAVDRYLAGEPDQWVSFPLAPTPQRGKICKVILSACASGSFSADQLIRRGAVACALIDALETAGVRCEVELQATFSERCPKDWANPIPPDFSDPASTNAVLSDLITLKQAQDPLDMERLVYWLAHPSALRRFFFRALEDRPPAIFEKFSCGYGMPADLPPPADCIFIGAMISADGAETQLNNAIAAAAAWLE
jgi:hypothetical protein